MRPLYVTEPGSTGGVGAMGMRILFASLQRAGFAVRRVRFDKAPPAEQGELFAPAMATVRDCSGLAEPSAWFVSLLNARQFWELPDMFRRMNLPLMAGDRLVHCPLVVFGGSAMINPEPVADFADLIALGDGEVTGARIAELLARGASKIDVLRELHGAPGFWAPPMGDAPLVRVNAGQIAEPLVPPEDGSANRHAIELARGCKFRCAFCPIGWASGRYVEASIEDVRERLRRLRGKSVNLFAPDTSSVSFADSVDAAAVEAGCRNTSRDARVVPTLARLRAGATARPYSFGVEGLSERLRRAVGKPIGDDELVATMAELERAGVRNVKWYMILALPGETDEDGAAFLRLLSAVREVYTGRLDLATTHLHGLPHTPLQWCDGHYSDAADARLVGIVEQAKAWNIAGREPGGKRGCEMWFQNWTKRATHDSDGYLYRGGREASRAIVDADSVAARVKDGRWRANVDVEASLAGRDVAAPLPWDHVDVGISKRAVAAGWAAYGRRMAK